MRVAIITLTRQGVELGQQLLKYIPDSSLCVAKRYTDYAIEPFQVFEAGDLRTLLASKWKNYDALICIMATGIVVRMIATLLESKLNDPAVVVIDDAGRFAISLLSGHLGGANELAKKCASIIGSIPVITTATDSNNLPSFDLLAKEYSFVIENISYIKVLNRMLLDNDSIAVFDQTGCSRNFLKNLHNITWYGTLPEATNSGAAGFLFITNQFLPESILPKNSLILHPRTFVLGIGCNRGTSSIEIKNLVQTIFKELMLSTKSIYSVATASAKADEPGLKDFCQILGVPLICFEPEELNRVSSPSEPSYYAIKAIGANGVAEPAALLASNNGNLLLQKIKSGNVTLAIAEMRI